MRPIKEEFQEDFKNKFDLPTAKNQEVFDQAKGALWGAKWWGEKLAKEVNRTIGGVVSARWIKEMTKEL